MPVVLVSDVLSEAQALLNDPGGAIFTSAVMIPLIDKAYREAQKKYIDNGIQVVNEVSTAFDVAANTFIIDPQVTIAATFLWPVWLKERADGSTSEDDWVDMEEKDWEPFETPRPTLDVWTWREQTLKFRGANVIREVKCRYIKGLAKLTAGSDPILIEGAQEFLASRSAAIAAMVIGENVTRAEVLQTDATASMETLLSINAKKRQNLPVRRKKYRRPRMNRIG